MHKYAQTTYTPTYVTVNKDWGIIFYNVSDPAELYYGLVSALLFGNNSTPAVHWVHMYTDETTLYIYRGLT